ncbi:MAG: chemoreceptor glutamine deamidase CheD [Proteobacteria bacterium]|nr:chemoreceptor glutamine deamidase CheD [Pseudomonadota bacterium]
MTRIPIRRTDSERVQVGDYYDGIKRYFDQVSELTVVKVFSGEYYVTADQGEMLVTILGSCVSACIRDPEINVGGMNHFLLPGVDGFSADSARFGAFAMEQLINEIIKLGGKKNRFEIKVFGGGNVTNSSALIGDKNSEFVRSFLREEGLKIASEDLGGKQPRRLHYFPDTGRVMVRKLSRREDMRIVDEESTYAQKAQKKNRKAELEMFT